MKTNVRGYTDEQLLNRVKSLNDFQGIPNNYWVLGVQSNENASNVFDDKFYLFHGEEFVKVFTGTTNTGTYGLKNFFKWNKKGAFVMKTNQWIYDFWKTHETRNGKRVEAKHKSKMRAWRQNKPCFGFRDNNKNEKAEQIGKMVHGMFGINFHTITYNLTAMVRKYIGGWSVGCQVANNTKQYYEVLDLVNPKQDTVTYCIIEEFDVSK